MKTSNRQSTAKTVGTKLRYSAMIEYFNETMPVAESELNYSTPFELLVAVILSAQCTDKRINQITPALFEKYPDAQKMSEAGEEDIFGFIRSVSYPNNKAKHLVGMAKMLVEKYGGEVPSTGEELEKLPGVGRKTANVIQAVIFQKAKMAVDTHVFRVSHRIGLVSSKCTTPLAVEKSLTKNIPLDIIPLAHHWLILHGRYVCKSRNPQCEKCGLQSICKHFSEKALQM
ncbi:MAG: endonuclease III [Bacteroidaceae bacterium]|jgi:endonuclease-3|nr:endonuclease III [Bacteroidaceae bacterium]